MDGPRTPVEQELPRLLDFLKLNLRSGCEWSFAEEYPTAFGAGNLHNLYVISEGENYLSHAALRPIIIKTPVAIFKAAAIGSVLTDEAHRNKGLSQKVIGQCIESALKQQCDIAILWTDLYDFYRKLGFELAGFEHSYELTAESLSTLPTSPSLRIVESPKVDPSALLKLLSKHTVSSVRTLSDIQKCLKIPNARVYTAWSGNGSLSAFAVEGKGADLSGYIHEWAGDVPSLLALFKHIAQSQNRAITVIAPESATALRKALSGVCTNSHQGYLGMVKILRPESLTQKAISAMHALNIEGLELEWTGKALAVTCGTESIEVSEEADLVRLFFGPEKPSDLIKNGALLSEKLNQLFPLPLWVWGWDSI